MIGRDRYLATLHSVEDLVDSPNGFQVRKLLSCALMIKQRIGHKPKPDEHDPGSGLLKELDEITQELVDCGGGQSLRHGQLVFVRRKVNGRTTTDWNMFVAELRTAGVEEDLIQECLTKSAKVGAGYFSAEYVDLNEERAKA